MKKVLLTFLAAVGLVVLVPVTSFAMGATTDIEGTVTYNGAGVQGAKVTVVCDNYAKHATTDASGAYSVQYKASQCPAGSNPNVVATKGDKGGVNNGKVPAGQTDLLNVAIINVSLPEFGLATGIGASAFGGGAFLVLRRRQLSGHKS